MKQHEHPTEHQLALYVGNDLGFWQQRKTRAHVSACTRCQQEVAGLAAGIGEAVRAADELPSSVNWQRLEQEMTGNIRVGYAAGECIAGFEKVIGHSRPRLVWHSAMVLAMATVVIVPTLWLNLPKQEMDHLMSSLGQIRWGRIGIAFHNPAVVQDAVILEASPSSTQIKSHGATLSFLHPQSDAVTVSVTTHDSAGVRYVDDATGQVTLNKVYYAQ